LDCESKRIEENGPSGEREMDANGDGGQRQQSKVAIFVDIGRSGVEHSVKFLATSQEEPNREDGVDGRDDTDYRLPHVVEWEGERDIVNLGNGSQIFPEVVTMPLHDVVSDCHEERNAEAEEKGSIFLSLFLFLCDEDCLRPGDAPEAILDTKHTTSNGRGKNANVEIDKIAPNRVRIANIASPDDGADGANE